jgi:hypothetical protein
MTNIFVSLLAAKIAGQYFIILGSCCTAVANLLYAILDENATYWTYQFFGQALSAVGSEAGNIIASIYIANVVDVTEVAAAGSTLQFAVMLANVCAPSLSTLVYTRRVVAKNGSLLSQEESKENEQLLTSLKASFWFWAAMGLLGKQSCAGEKTDDSSIETTLCTSSRPSDGFISSVTRKGGQEGLGREK